MLKKSNLLKKVINSFKNTINNYFKKCVKPVSHVVINLLPLSQFCNKKLEQPISNKKSAFI